MASFPESIGQGTSKAKAQPSQSGGWAAESDYAEWGATTEPIVPLEMQRITFYLNGSMQTGPGTIRVITEEGDSNYGVSTGVPAKKPVHHWTIPSLPSIFFLTYLGKILKCTRNRPMVRSAVCKAPSLHTGTGRYESPLVSMSSHMSCLFMDT